MDYLDDEQWMPQPFEVRRLSVNSTTVEGYVAVFDSLSSDLGGFREKVARGAFEESLRMWPDVRLLANHEGLAIARTTNASLSLSEDFTGLRFRAVLNPDDPEAMAVLSKVRSGTVSGMSFGFTTQRDRWERTSEGTVRTLLAVRLHEASVVTFPAYTAASIVARTRPPAPAGSSWRPSVAQLRRRLALAEATLH